MSSRETELEAKLAEWIAYADKLEKVIELVAGSAADKLRQMQAQEGLRIVKPAALGGIKE